MPKLIDNEPSRFMQIGRDGLLRFLDEMNAKRAFANIRRRYRPVEDDNGVLMSEFWDLPLDLPANARGPVYSGLRIVQD